MPAQILITPVPELFVLFRGPSEAGGSVDAECIHPLEVVQELVEITSNFWGALRRLSRRAQVRGTYCSTPTGSRGWARVGLGVPTVVFVVVIWPVGRLPRVYTANTQTLSTAGSCLSTAQSRSSHFVFIMIYAASGGVVVRRAAHLEVGALRRFFQFLFPGSFLSSLLLLHFLFDVLRVPPTPYLRDANVGSPKK